MKNHTFILLFSLILFSSFSIVAMNKGEKQVWDVSQQVEQSKKKQEEALEQAKNEGKKEGEKSVLEMLKNTQPDQFGKDLKEASETSLQKYIELEKQTPGTFESFQPLIKDYESRLIDYFKNQKKFNPVTVNFIQTIKKPIEDNAQKEFWSKLAKTITHLDSVDQIFKSNAEKHLNNVLDAIEKGTLDKTFEQKATIVKNLLEKKSNEKSLTNSSKFGITTRDVFSFLGGSTLIGALWLIKTTFFK